MRPSLRLYITWITNEVSVQHCGHELAVPLPKKVYKMASTGLEPEQDACNIT